MDTERKERFMSDGKVDEAKGRVKEAGGDLTDDKGLKREGKVDRATGTVKDKVDDASDKAKDVAGKG
ncbi:MAG: CsbD family protein [Solirubrobacteraceae bacterium]|jgi:uncharacterized protein YjbJ (UPF0337 family)